MHIVYELYTFLAPKTTCFQVRILLFVKQHGNKLNVSVL